MSWTLRTLTACAVLVAVACGDSNEAVKIVAFQAATDAIEVGQSTKLFFTVSPTDAKVSITGIPGDLTGQTSVSVTPGATTTYQLTATKGSSIANQSVTVTVGATTASAIKVEPATTTPTAGDHLSVVVTVLGPSGKAAPGFRGTIHLASTDSKAILPADITFTAQDMGTRTVMVTLETAGVSTMTATDTTSKTGVQGSASVTVQPGAASVCVASQAPASAAAGSVVGLTVALRDAFGNAATSYAGTVQLTATDPRASLPGNVTYVPASDRGSHAFSVALLTTGDQTLTATDTASSAIQCTTKVTVTPGALKLVVTVSADANAGYAVPVNVAVVDVFDNARPGFKGTLSFASTDSGTGASAPGSITFAGTENGLASTTATFVTIGSQTLSGSVVEDVTTAQTTSSAVAKVHGLVYTAPGTGRVRLVANAAQSSSQVVQLDLVANERLVVSTFFGGGPGSFAAGMNLPLDTSRVMADTTLFTAGNALPLGTGTPAAIGRIGSDQVLYTGVSRKRVAGTNFVQETEVQKGQVFYSVRLRLTQAGTVGAAFDGAQPSPLYRASVRDQYGDDFVNQSDFGVGRLEIR